MLKRHLRLYEKYHCWLKSLQNETKSWTKSVIILRMMLSFSFCAMLWTVRGETWESFLENHAELLELWEWSLANDRETDMKGRIIGVNFIMKKFNFYFGCCLGKNVLRQTDILSKSLQSSSLSAAVSQCNLCLGKLMYF